METYSVRILCDNCRKGTNVLARERDAFVILQIKSIITERVVLVTRNRED